MAKENSIQERIVTGSYFILILSLVIIGFYFIATKGLTFDDQLVKIYIIYAVLNMVLPIITLIDVLADVKWFKSWLFRPQDSLISLLYQKDKSNKLLGFFNTINNNFLLSFILWHVPFMILSFVASLLAPQSATSIFLQRFIFPVRPQTIFGIEEYKFFFTLFPSPSETGALTVLISLTSSIINYLLSFFLSPLVITFILLFVVGGLLSGLFWRTIHKTVSAGREIDAFGHLFFGIQSGVLIILTGQITPALALHNSNLFYWVLRDTLTSYEFLRYGLLWTLIFVVVLVISAIAVVRFRRLTKGKKKKK